MKINRKKLAFWLLLVGVTGIACELSTRLFFAILVGPNVLLYGTEAFRTEVKSFPSVVMAKVGYTPPTPEGYQIPIPGHAYTKFSPNEVKSDKDEKGKRFHPTINSRGFRGAEFSDKTRSGVIRVVTLGASSTFGYHNRDDETYPYYMEALLNAASNGNKTFEVINLGLPHMDSEQILSIFVNEALPLQPDVVTFYEGWNDATKAADALGKERGSLRRPAFTSLIRNSYAGMRDSSLMAALFDSLLYYVGDSDVDEDLQHLIEKTSLRFLGNISSIKEVCSRNNILFVLANQQSRSELIERERVKQITFRQEVQIVRDKLTNKGRLARREAAFLVHSSIMQSLGQWTEINKVPLVNVIHALDADRNLLLTYVHPNPKANRVIAQEFVKEISKHL